MYNQQHHFLHTAIDYYGIAENEYGWWKIEGGKVNFDYTGLADSDNGRMYVSNTTGYEIL